MRDFIVIFIAVVIAKPDLPPVQPPGTYPLEEMNTEISTVPMNPYQLAMIDTSGNFDNYQFYYEKDALPPSVDHDFINVHVTAGPTPPPDTKSLQVVVPDTNGLDGPIAFYDTSTHGFTSVPKQLVPPLGYEDEEHVDDERLQRKRKISTGSTESLEKPGIAIPPGRIDLHNENVSDLNSYKKATHTETKPESAWSRSRPVSKESDLMKKSRTCCPCCRSPTYISLNGKELFSFSVADTKGSLNRSAGEQKMVNPSILDNYDYDGHEEQQKPGKYKGGTYHTKPNNVDKPDLYNAISSSKSPSEVGFTREISPISSHWEDLPSYENDLSYVGHSSARRIAAPMHPASVYQLTPPSFSAVLPSQQVPYGVSACPCAAPPTLPCCAPVQPCCLPSLPCCPPPPPVPCCPRLPVCCQPPPCCPLQPVCCPVMAMPPCFRACPICPCRRRLHQALRIKRSPGFMDNGKCTKCAVGGQPKRALIKRQSNCMACSNNPFASLFAHSSSTCSTCGRSDRRTARVKRMGCQPCGMRMKREVVYEDHRRVKRFGCMPCLGRKKRSPENCRQCSNLGEVLQRFKRSFLCSPCGRKKRETKANGKSRSSCSCSQKPSQGLYTRKKREVDNEFDTTETCDKTCCDYSRCSRTSDRKFYAFANSRSLI